MKRVLNFAAVALLVAGAAACGEHPMYTPDARLEMQLEMDDSVATVTGETIQLVVMAHDGLGRAARPPILLWESHDPEIATVDQSGEVTAHRDGVATITVRAGDAGAATSRVYVKATVKSFAWISAVATPDRSAGNDRDSTSVVVRRGER